MLLQQLSKDPLDRYPTGSAFVRALADAGGVAADVEGRTLRHDAVDTGPTAPVADRPSPAPSTHIAGTTDRHAPDNPPSSGRTPAPPPRRVPPPSQPTQPTPPRGSATGPGQAASTTGRSPLPPPPSGLPDDGPGVAATAILSGGAGEPLLDIQTLFKLVVGVTVILLLLMTFLPTPRDPLATSVADRLLVPRAPAATSWARTSLAATR